MDYLETDLDKINRYYRNKIVTIITTPTMFGPTDIKNLAEFSTGCFLEATDSGVWLLSLSNNLRDFFYHDKIIKIETSQEIDLTDLSEEQKTTLDTEFKKYEARVQREIDLLGHNLRKDSNKQVPDVLNPNDNTGINNMIHQVQDMLKNQEETKDNDFLQTRRSTEQAKSRV